MGEFFAGLGQDIFSYIIAHRVISFLTFIFGSGVIFSILKKWWEPVAAPVFYAIVSGGVIFICVWLLIQSDRQFVNDKSSRPYFSTAGSDIQKLFQGSWILTVSVQNNDIPAQDVSSQLLVLPESLDPTKAPLFTNREESANPIGPRMIFNHRWWPITVNRNTLPAFIVFQIRYSDSLSNETFSQAFYLKFLGTSQDGTFIQQLMNADSYEKTRMERYMKERGIPML